MTQFFIEFSGLMCLFNFQLVLFIYLFAFPPTKPVQEGDSINSIVFIFIDSANGSRAS